MVSSKKKSCAPILFLTFNRAKETKEVFKTIRKAKPQKLFLASDGPREHKKGEKKIILEIRKFLLKNVTWKCEVKTLFREKNLGCKYAVSGAIDWFFDNVEEGIILEDDCLPSESFYPFCTTMLQKYRNHNNIMHISGTNVEKQSKINSDYFFARVYNVWGWATWRSAWKRYDVNVKKWPHFKKRKSFLKKYSRPIKKEYSFVKKSKIRFLNILEKKEHIKGMNDLYEKKTDTWDFQWAFSCMIHDGLAIIPSKNLIQNIGFGTQNTHMKRKKDKNLSLSSFTFDFPLTLIPAQKINESYEESARNFFYQNRYTLQNISFAKLFRFLSILKTK